MAAQVAHGAQGEDPVAIHPGCGPGALPVADGVGTVEFLNPYGGAVLGIETDHPLFAGHHALFGGNGFAVLVFLGDAVHHEELARRHSRSAVAGIDRLAPDDLGSTLGEFLQQPGLVPHPIFFGSEPVGPVVGLRGNRKTGCSQNGKYPNSLQPAHGHIRPKPFFHEVASLTNLHPALVG